jgi:hypothetical protein
MLLPRCVAGSISLLLVPVVVVVVKQGEDEEDGREAVTPMEDMVLGRAGGESVRAEQRY